MKATLEFTLPEEAEEHQIAVDALKWRGVVSDALEELRKVEGGVRVWRTA